MDLISDKSQTNYALTRVDRLSKSMTLRKIKTNITTVSRLVAMDILIDAGMRMR